MHSPLLQIFALNTSTTRLLRGGSFCLVFAVASLFVPPMARAVDPPPDGGYANQNTAVGDAALFNFDVTLGRWNTAVGAFSLYNNSSGEGNTAVGNAALGASFATHSRGNT